MEAEYISRHTEAERINGQWNYKKCHEKYLKQEEDGNFVYTDR